MGHVLKVNIFMSTTKIIYIAENQKFKQYSVVMIHRTRNKRCVPLSRSPLPTLPSSFPSSVLRSYHGSQSSALQDGDAGGASFPYTETTPASTAATTTSTLLFSTVQQQHHCRQRELEKGVERWDLELRDAGATTPSASSIAAKIVTGAPARCGP